MTGSWYRRFLSIATSYVPGSAVTIALVLVCAAALGAPPHPISGADGARLAEIEAAKKELRENDYEARRALAREELTIRKRNQPEAWWQVRHARDEVEFYDRILSLSADDQTAFEEVWAAWERSMASDYDRAIEAARDKLRFVRQHFGDNHFLVVKGKADAALAASIEDDFVEADRLWREAISAIRQEYGLESPAFGDALVKHSDTLARINRIAEGEERCRRGIDVLVACLGPAHRDVLFARLSLGFSLVAQGRMNEGKAEYRAALAALDKSASRDDPLRIAALDGLARICSHMGEYGEAIEIAQEIHQSRRRTLGDEHPATITVLENLASLMSEIRPEESEALYRRVLELRAKVQGASHTDTLETRLNLASQLYAKGRLAEAELVFRSVVDTPFDHYQPHFAPSLVRARSSLAMVLLDQGRIEQAEAMMREDIERMSRAFGRRHWHTIDSKAKLARILTTRGSFAEAERLFRWIQASVHGNQQLDRFLGLHLYLGLLRYAQGDFPGAEQELLLECKKLEAARERSYKFAIERTTFSSQFRTHEMLATVQARLGKHREAFESLESGLARGFLDDLTGDPLAGGHESARPRDLDSIQRTLAPDAAIVAWADWDWQNLPTREHWVFLLRRKGNPIAVRLQGTGPNGAWIDADMGLPARVRERLTRNANPVVSPSRGTRLRIPVDHEANAADLEAILRQLRAQCLKPIEEFLGATNDLPAVTHLIVVRKERMARIPVEAMAPEYVVSYTPSASTLCVLQQRGRLADRGNDEPRLLAIAGNGGGDNDLIGARSEVELIAQLFEEYTPTDEGSRPRAHLLVGGDATEAKLRRAVAGRSLDGVTHLHFAGHATVDPTRPMDSCLHLTSEGNDDGRLTLRELLAIDSLAIEHVVLSACDTAGGRDLGSEGVLGFERAFLAAGTRSLLVSQWKIDDIATSLLICRYYANCLLRQQPAAHALKSARDWLRGLSAEQVDRLRAHPADIAHEAAAMEPGDAPYGAPYYWASFVLIGSG